MHIITIIDPGVKKMNLINYQDDQKGYFVKAPNGQVYVNKVWPGDAVYPDLVVKQLENGGRNCKFLVDLKALIWNLG